MRPAVGQGARSVSFRSVLRPCTVPRVRPSLNEVLSMLWIDYAQEEPERLSPKARDLRTELLDRLRAT